MQAYKVVGMFKKRKYVLKILARVMMRSVPDNLQPVKENGLPAVPTFRKNANAEL